MAKKVVEKPKFHPEGGKGLKQCPACKMFSGAKSAKCANPECGHELPVKEAKAKKESKGEPSLKAVLQTITDAGGVKKVEDALASYEAANEIVSKLGGLNSAKEVVELLKSMGQK